MKIIAKQKIPANLELTACYAKRPDSYFLVNYGALNGDKNLNCIELTCKQIIEIINDKVRLKKTCSEHLRKSFSGHLSKERVQSGSTS